MSNTFIVEVLPATILILIIAWKAEMNWRYRTNLARYFEMDRTADKVARYAMDLQDKGLSDDDPRFTEVVSLWYELRAKADALKPWS